MGKRDERIDAYIAQSAEFAQPILKHLRELVHQACPDMEETMKWSFPHFDYKGNVCSMASFKQHCSFGFWKASLLSDPHRILSKIGETAMGQFGQIKSMEDLPSDDMLIEYIREAVRLNQDGIKVPARAPSEKKEMEIPGYFSEALRTNADALQTFEAFSPSSKKEYVEWITEAKSEATRDKRMATALEWIAEGKTRHWKYAKK